MPVDNVAIENSASKCEKQVNKFRMLVGRLHPKIRIWRQNFVSSHKYNRKESE